MVEILVPLAFFATIFGIIYLFVSTRNRERLALIEKGIDASIFDRSGSKSSLWGTLKLGMLAVGVALGIVIGNVLESAGLLSGEAGFPAMIFLFAGLALILNFWIERRQREKKASENQSITE